MFISIKALEAEKSLAYKNMELLNVKYCIFIIDALFFNTSFSKHKNYLLSLSESLKTHSLKEIERTHHLIAVDNVLNICTNEKLYEVTFYFFIFLHIYK